MLRASLNARLAVDVDHDRATRRCAHLHVMVDATKRVAHVPIIGPRLSFDGRASLNFLVVYLRAAATHIGADCSACDSAARCRNVATASAADLMTEDAANHRTRDRCRDIGTVAALV